MIRVLPLPVLRTVVKKLPYKFLCDTKAILASSMKIQGRSLKPLDLFKVFKRELCESHFVITFHIITII
ncbi:hypothetical protein AMS66_25765 [Paenibacillus xylanivorans]|uniref:Uncharacterized protein n=1 Tax=Paenibacillus xylanivorans TaxID=1705561 RepID=A0A0M9BJY1_9BACL|nr:hypothetical protein AMS66_25765 [Paenibacillus xylanivorans]